MAGEKKLNVSLDEELHKEMKKAAIDSNMTITEFVRQAIQEKIASLQKKGA